MLIDWFTVVAQWVNLIILAWLLKRFLYGPIIKAMQDRKNVLADELNHAREAREEAEHRARYQLEKLTDLEREAQSFLSEARTTANDQREQWLSEAKTEVEIRRRGWEEILEREQAAIADSVRHRIGVLVVHLSKKVLMDLAGDALEERVLDGFMQHLAKTESNDHMSDDVLVRTGFPLSQAVLQRLNISIHKIFPNCQEITITQDDSLGFGVLMVGGDSKWEWNITSYLNEVETSIFAELSALKVGTP